MTSKICCNSESIKEFKTHKCILTKIQKKCEEDIKTFIIKSVKGDQTSLTYDTFKTEIQAKYDGIYRVCIIDDDGRFMFDNTKTLAEVNEIENHNTRPEVMMTLNMAYGSVYDSGIYKNSYLKKCVEKGYGIGSRISNTSGSGTTVSHYVATYFGGPCNNISYTLRVSNLN
jgi:hypothetical protein